LCLSLPSWATFSSSADTVEDSGGASADDLGIDEPVVPVDAFGNQLKHKDQQIQYVLNNIFSGEVENAAPSANVTSSTSSALWGIATDCVCGVDHVVLFGLFGGALLSDAAGDDERTGAAAADALIASQRYDDVVTSHDPLRRRMDKDNLLAAFSETDVAFAPTGFSTEGPGYFSRVLTRSNVALHLRTVKYGCDEAAATSEFLPVVASLVVPIARTPVTTFLPSYDPLPQLEIVSVKWELTIAHLAQSDPCIDAHISASKLAEAEKDAHFHSDGSPRVCSKPMMTVDGPMSPLQIFHDEAPASSTIVGSSERSRRLVIDYKLADAAAVKPLLFVTNVMSRLETTRVVFSLYDRRAENGSGTVAPTKSRLVAAAAFAVDEWFSGHAALAPQTVIAVAQRGGRTVGRCVMQFKWSPSPDSEVLVRGMW
jgi:hypothetical protein